VLATCLLAVVANPVLPTRVGYEPAPAATRLDWLGPRNCAQIAHAHMSSACHLSNLGHSVGYKRARRTDRLVSDALSGKTERRGQRPVDGAYWGARVDQGPRLILIGSRVENHDGRRDDLHTPMLQQRRHR